MTFRFSLRCVITALFFLWLAAGLIPASQVHAATTWIVQSAADGAVNASNCPGASCRLRDAIAAASSGDTITFADNYTILLAAQLDITTDLTIDGAGHTVTVSGNNAVRVFYVNSELVFNLQNLTVVNGYLSSAGGHGAGLSSTNSTLNIANSTFSNNNAYYYGGVIASTGGMITITNSVFSNNSSRYTGGAIGLSCPGMMAGCDSILTITDSTFSNNNGYDGGAIEGGWNTHITRSNFIGNRAAVAGGAIYSAFKSTLTVMDSTFSGNTTG